MGLADAVKMGGAYVPIGADLKGLETKLKEAQGKLSAFGGKLLKLGAGLSAAGLAILAPLTKSVQQFTKYGDNIAKIGRRAGISAQSFSELGYASEITGAGLNAVERAIKKMQQCIYDAERGMKTYVDALVDAGVSTEDLKGKKSEEHFYIIANALSNLEDKSKKAALAQKIFGRAGTHLVPLFNAGAESIKKLRNEYTFLTGDVDFTLAEDMQDAFTRLKFSLMGVSMTIAQRFAPTLRNLMDRVTMINVKLRGFLSRHPQIITSLGKVGVALTALGGTFMAVGVGLMAATSPLIFTTGVITGLTATIVVAVGSILDSLGVLDVGVNSTLDSLANGFTIFDKTLSDWVYTIQNSLSLGFISIIDFVVDGTHKAFGVIQDWMKGIMKSFAKFFSVFDQGIAQKLKGLVDKVPKVKVKFFDDLHEKVQAFTWNAFQANELFEAAIKERNKGKPELTNILKDFMGTLSGIYSGVDLSKYKITPPMLPTVPEDKTSRGVVGFFGGRMSEMLGGPQKISRDQLKELKKISQSLLKIEKNPVSMKAVYE